MKRRWWQRARFEIIRRYGLWLYSVKMGRVERQRRRGRVVYKKQRYWRTAPLVALANPMLKATGSTVQGLPLGDWLWWEVQLAPHTMRAAPEVDDKCLYLPEIVGVRLGDYLSATGDIATRCAAVMSAAQELQRLHTLIMRRPDGEVAPFSHGDSHVNNVIYNAELCAATWFDYEAIHVTTLPIAQRYADDWRAFGYSAATYFSVEELPELAALVALYCGGNHVRHELAKLADSLYRCPTGIHLAQAHLDYERHQGFCEALARALSDQ